MMIDLAINAITEAGKAIVKARQDDFFKSRIKLDGTCCTSGDEVSHEILLKLGEKTCLPVISEEMSKDTFDEMQRRYNDKKMAWIVDPLDGTKEYLKGLSEFCISVALIKEGKPVIGVIYAPDEKLLIYSEKGHGAWMLVGDVHIKIFTSKESVMRSMVVLASASELNKEAYPVFTKNLSRLAVNLGHKEIIALGSTTLKSALIGLGYADYYYTFTSWNHQKKKVRITKEWDIAATNLIVEEAGGMMTNCEGKEFAFGKHDPKNYKGIFVTNSKNNHYSILKKVVGDIDLEKIQVSQ